MAGRRLTANVWVHRPDGDPVMFGPGDDVPEWAAALITNPKVWDSPAPVAAAEPAEVVEEPAVSQPSEDGLFDPGEHNAKDVLAYLESLTDDQADEYARVIDAEAAGKARKGILGDSGE